MTNDVNLARPDEQASPAQDDHQASPAQDDHQASPAQPEAEASDPAPATEPEPIPDPAAERDEYRDLLLRKQAEFDNYKKRVERDRKKANRQSERTLIMALLPLLDDFERALGAPAEAGGPRRTAPGSSSSTGNCSTCFAGAGSRRSTRPAPGSIRTSTRRWRTRPATGARTGDVIDELRRGYLLDEELLRAAMVRVAKA